MPDFLTDYDGGRRSWRDTDKSAEQRGVYTALSLAGHGNDSLDAPLQRKIAPAAASVYWMALVPKDG